MKNQIEDKEKVIMSLLVQAHNLYVELESTHPDDMIDWKNSIHRSQDILSRRILRRDYPDVYVTIKPKPTFVQECAECKGSGIFRSGPFSERCNICKGKGRIEIEFNEIPVLEKEPNSDDMRLCISCGGSGEGSGMHDMEGSCRHCKGTGKIDY